MSTERDNLEIHVDLCSLRYEQLNNRLDSVDARITSLNAEVDAFKVEVRQNFDEIKSLLGTNQGEKFRVMIATSGTIIVALIGMLGYVITHIPK